LTDDPLREAYDLIKSGHKSHARDLIEEHIKNYPQDEKAWSLLYFAVDREEEKRECLEEVLEINPDNEKALKALDKLDKTSKRSRKSFLRWSLLIFFGLIVGSFVTIVIRYLAERSAYEPAVPTSTAMVEIIAETIPPTFTLNPTDTPVPTFTLGPPPTNVVAPTPVFITFTPQPTHSPTITVIPSATLEPGAKADVQIIDIFYLGDIRHRESDEYIEFANLGNAPVDMNHWMLLIVSSGKRFIFPEFTLLAGQSCRVYTDEEDSEYCNFRFKSKTSLLNDTAECIRLYDHQGGFIDEMCYKRN